MVFAIGLQHLLTHWRGMTVRMRQSVNLQRYCAAEHLYHFFSVQGSYLVHSRGASWGHSHVVYAGLLLLFSVLSAADCRR